MRQLVRMDLWIDQKVQAAPHARGDKFFKGVSKEFSFLIAFVLPLVGVMRDGIAPWGFVWISGVFAFITTKGVKQWIGRNRPQEERRTTIHLDDEAGSFPSRHVAVISAEAMILFLFGSSWTCFWMIAMVLVAVARVGLREHFFTDVVFGFGWGLLNGWIVELIKGVLTS